MKLNRRNIIILIVVVIIVIVIISFLRRESFNPQTYLKDKYDMLTGKLRVNQYYLVHELTTNTFLTYNRFTSNLTLEHLQPLNRGQYWIYTCDGMLALPVDTLCVDAYDDNKSLLINICNTDKDGEKFKLTKDGQLINVKTGRAVSAIDSLFSERVKIPILTHRVGNLSKWEIIPMSKQMYTMSALNPEKMSGMPYTPSKAYSGVRGLEYVSSYTEI